MVSFHFENARGRLSTGSSGRALAPGCHFVLCSALLPRLPQLLSKLLRRTALFENCPDQKKRSVPWAGWPLAAHTLVLGVEQGAWERERDGRSQEVAASGGHARSKESAVLIPYTLLKGEHFSTSQAPRGGWNHGSQVYLSCGELVTALNTWPTATAPSPDPSNYKTWHIRAHLSPVQVPRGLHRDGAVQCSRTFEDLSHVRERLQPGVRAAACCLWGFFCPNLVAVHKANTELGIMAKGTENKTENVLYRGMYCSPVSSKSGPLCSERMSRIGKKGDKEDWRHFSSS